MVGPNGPLQYRREGRARRWWRGGPGCQRAVPSVRDSVRPG
ncbi:hypothetical protein HSR122_2403 [Halapricum desulfuricans]|uniref:Uncharacterized protein n=1 Tax=Halapricum desulfuricans TaxID=2841257 RepID=A0A897N5V5_9EURY|nr:hypothetical protein HSR122_2403 [Halapricum desulfuricans]